MVEWDLNHVKMVRTFKGGSDGVTKLSVSSDDAVLASASSTSIKLWDLDSGKKSKRLASGHTSAVCALTFSKCNVRFEEHCLPAKRRCNDGLLLLLLL